MSVGRIALIGFDSLQQFNGFPLGIDEYSEFPLSNLTTNRTSGVDYDTIKVYPLHVHDVPEKDNTIRNTPFGRINDSVTYKQINIRLKAEKVPDDYSNIREILSLSNFKYLALQILDYIDDGFIHDTGLVIAGYADYNVTTTISGYRHIEITFHTLKGVAGFG